MNADIAALAKVPDPVERVKGCVTVLAAILAEAGRVRDERDARVYLGHDGRDLGPSGCDALDVEQRPLDKVDDTARLAFGLDLDAVHAAAGTDSPPPAGVTVGEHGRWLVPVRVPCTGDHKARRVCPRHYWQLQDGWPWDEGTPERPGLGLSAAPAPAAPKPWKTLAKTLGQLAQGQVQRILGRRWYPDGKDTVGYWRVRDDDGEGVYRLPDPPAFETQEALWTEVGELHAENLRLLAIADEIRDKVRNPAMRELMALYDDETIAEFAGLKKNVVYKMRRRDYLQAS